ncbi:hypothetical protein MHYP_G00286090 [Metynnis hypsauchen]
MLLYSEDVPTANDDISVAGSLSDYHGGMQERTSHLWNIDAFEMAANGIIALILLCKDALSSRQERRRENNEELTLLVCVPPPTPYSLCGVSSGLPAGFRSCHRGPGDRRMPKL